MPTFRLAFETLGRGRSWPETLLYFSVGRPALKGSGSARAKWVSTMETQRFGNTGMEVSVLGLGTAEIGFEEVAGRTLDAIF